ncbi:hypothetical protein [Marinitoga lauensis]|uniref:hypothetical protein n=1 Tax=Marinitoga lauensis TaxID=2201189 RepID=UPI001012C28F|nr:hypothetical protein [Marinitoga lauensis]
MKKCIIVIILLILSIGTFSNNSINILNAYLKNFDSFTKKELDNILKSFNNAKNMDNLLKIIHGSILVKKSRYEWFFPLKYYYIYAGMLEMKEVVKSDFDNLIYRYIRGKTAYEIINYDFSREIFINDFEYIYIRANEKFKENYDFGEILFKLSKIYKHNNLERSKKLLGELKEYKNSYYYRMIYDEK